MRTLTFATLFVLTTSIAYAGGMSDEELLCDLSSRPPSIVDAAVGDEGVAEYVNARTGPNTHNKVAVCLSVESDFSILGAPWRRRDIVEVPFQSSIISEVEKEKNPDLVYIGRFVYVFSELRAKEGEWGLSPYTPVKGQQLPSSVTSINAAAPVV